MKSFLFSCNESQFLNFTPGCPVFVFGTFNLWQQEPISKWALKNTGRGQWELEKPFSELSLIGNTGFPEFRYFQAVKNTKKSAGKKAVCKAIYKEEKKSCTDEKVTYKEEKAIYNEEKNIYKATNKEEGDIRLSGKDVFNKAVDEEGKSFCDKGGANNKSNKNDKNDKAVYKSIEKDGSDKAIDEGSKSVKTKAIYKEDIGKNEGGGELFLDCDFVTLEEKVAAFSDMLFSNHVVFDCEKNEDLLEFERIAKVRVIKTLADFDITKKSERETLSNVRKVPGTKALFRGYHPYKKSRLELDTEALRTRTVNEYLIENGIKSIISLCGDEEPIKELGEVKSDYFLAIEKAHRRLSLDIDYNCAYYGSSGELFAKTMKNIVHFILASEAPFYVHCRLGSDRTGVVCATLATLCGVSSDEIEADYERTTEAGIGEFRSKKLLRYALSCVNIGKLVTKKEQAELKKKLCD